jgi:hypothetical protein
MTKEEAEKFELELLNRDYKKYVQHYKNEDFMYWKGYGRQYDENNNKYGGYSVGFAFYDYSKYPQFREKECISVSREFLLGTDMGFDRLDITITDNKMSIEEFEEFSAQFYEFFKTKIRKDEKKEG